MSVPIPDLNLPYPPGSLADTVHSACRRAIRDEQVSHAKQDKDDLALIRRYQNVVERIWRLFEKDPLGNDPAQGLCDRMEALLDAHLLLPRTGDLSQVVYSTTARAHSFQIRRDPARRGCSRIYLKVRYGDDGKLLYHELGPLTQLESQELQDRVFPPGGFPMRCKLLLIEDPE